MLCGRPCVLVRWFGLDAAGDTWEPLDNLTDCEAAIAAFEQAAGRFLLRPAQPSPPLAAASGEPPPIPPAGFTVEAAPPGDLGAALVGRTVLYWCPYGCQRGTVARLCQRITLSHVVGYTLQTSALRGTADTLLGTVGTLGIACMKNMPLHARVSNLLHMSSFSNLLHISAYFVHIYIYIYIFFLLLITTYFVHIYAYFGYSLHI